MGAFITIIRELMDHPRVGAIGFIFAVCAAWVGYTWGNDKFATNEQITSLELVFEQKLNLTKHEIINKLDEKMIKREVVLTEDSIRKITQQINLGLCADPGCSFNKAEKEVLERRVQSLKDELQ